MVDSRRSRSFVPGLLALLAVASVAPELACGAGSLAGPPDGPAGGADGGEDRGGDAAETIAPVLRACEAFCVAAAPCSAGTTVDDCVGYTCLERGGDGPVDSYPAACQDAFQAYWECAVTLPNICERPGSCAAVADRVAAACS